MQPTQLDPSVVNLVKAIRQTESGGNFQAVGKSGEYGAYQFEPTTFATASQKYLGQSVPLNKATPEQQNEVAYKQIAEWKSQGYNVGQIASMWNAGPGKPNAYLTGNAGVNSSGVNYDTAAYAKKVATVYQQFKAQTPVAPTANASTGDKTQSQDDSGALFPASPNDSGLTAGLKAIGNLPGSALNFAKGVMNSLNPFQTTNTVSNIGSGFSDLSQTEGAGQAILDIIKGLPEATYNTLVPQSVRQAISGDVSGAAQSFTNDPFGQAAPIVLAAEGGAKLADKYAGGNAAAADNIAKKGGTFNVAPNGDVVNPGKYSGGLNTAAEAVSKPVIGAAEAVSKAPLAIGRGILSHLTSLSPETISAIVSDPGSFSKLQQEATSRASVADTFKSSLDELIQQKSDTGAEYQDIRKSTTPIAVPENFITSTLDKYGLNVKDGVITADTNSLTRNKADISALQNFYDNWGNKTTLTPNEFLNMRGDIAELSKFDSAKSGAASTIGKALYADANASIRPQIKGLNELDTKMSPQIEMFKKAKKDFLNADGTFKDGALNKIANAKGVGKENLLGRMEQISPGIGKSIQILKAVEDIQKANGIKVGSYVKSVVEGGAIVTGNIPLIITAILTNPSIATYILRGFGVTGKAVLPIVSILQNLAGGAKNYSSIGLANNQNKKQ